MSQSIDNNFNISKFNNKSLNKRHNNEISNNSLKNRNINNYNVNTTKHNLLNKPVFIPSLKQNILNLQKKAPTKLFKKEEYNNSVLNKDDVTIKSLKSDTSINMFEKNKNCNKSYSTMSWNLADYKNNKSINYLHKSLNNKANYQSCISSKTKHNSLNSISYAIIHSNKLSTSSQDCKNNKFIKTKSNLSMYINHDTSNINNISKTIINFEDFINSKKICNQINEVKLKQDKVYNLKSKSLLKKKFNKHNELINNKTDITNDNILKNNLNNVGSYSDFNTDCNINNANSPYYLKQSNNLYNLINKSKYMNTHSNEECSHNLNNNKIYNLKCKSNIKKLQFNK